jgi:hypothetical protein
MRDTASTHFWRVVRIACAFAGLAACPGMAQAQLGLPGLPPLPDLGGGGGGGGQTQTLTGQASAVTAVILGSVTSLADTGTLSSPADPLGTGLPIGSIPGLVTAEALHAATMGWTDQVVSEASLGNLAMTVAGTGVSADLILSRAQAVSGSGAAGATIIEGLSIGGVPISPSGVPNQVISLPGLSVTLNEQIQSAGGIVVNALRVRTLDGLTDVVIGSARAGI